MQVSVFDIETIDWTTEYMLGAILNSTYELFKGHNCVKKFITYLRDVKFDGTIYAHNGGKFDFLFLIKALKDYHIPFSYIVNNDRAYCVKFKTTQKKTVTFKDSYLFLPYSLDYLMKVFFGKGKRHVQYDLEWITAHQEEFESYLYDDCFYLKGILETFEAEHKIGQALSIAGVAYHNICREYADKIFHYKDMDLRKDYYGGRVEIFKTGVFDQVYHYDVNSLYPFCMSQVQFPTDVEIWTTKTFVGDGIYKVDLTVLNKELSPIPVRTSDGSIYYPYGKIKDYWLDFNSLMSYQAEGNIRIDKIKEAIRFIGEPFNFGEFVSRYYEKKRSDVGGLQLLYKIMLNSCYGKFAQNEERGEYVFDGKKETFKESKFRGLLNHIYAVLIVNTARNYMYHFYQRYFDKLIYTDTDSIVTSDRIDVPLSDRIGDFKETSFQDFEAISKKSYRMRDKGHLILRVKGFYDIQSMAEWLAIQNVGVVQEGMAIRKSLNENSPQRYRIVKKMRLFNTGRKSNDLEHDVKELTFD